MSMPQELRALGTAALQLPRALRRRGCGSIHYVAERNARYPVLLVHGYAATESVWTSLRRALVEARFGHIISLTYNSFVMDPIAVSAELRRQALRMLAVTGAPRVHLVGHSLGGLTICRDVRLIRSLVTELIRTETFANPIAPTGADRELMAV
jgi:pimeloyl-ACP methyl ester carboxylesterase